VSTYSFTLILTGLGEATDEAAEAIYGAVRDDSVFASRDGVASIRFAHGTESLEEAIRSAIADVRNAGFETRPLTAWQ
jgi:hypothetical protein